MHVVFEKDQKIYKILKSRFAAQDSMEKFVFEAENLNFLRRFGLPTARVLCIKKPGELIDNFHVLVELMFTNGFALLSQPRTLPGVFYAKNKVFLMDIKKQDNVY